MCGKPFERGGETYSCQAPLLPENKFCSVCFPSDHKKRNRQFDVEKNKKIAEEKKKQEAKARQLEVKKNKKIAEEKKKQEARQKQQELTEKIENKYKIRFEKEKIKAVEIIKKESTKELQKQKLRHTKELEKLSDEIAELRIENTLLKNKLHQNQPPSGPSEKTDNCFYCSNWAVADKTKTPANPCVRQREKGSYYCESHQPDSSVLKLTKLKKLDYETYGHKVKLHFIREWLKSTGELLENEDLVVDLEKFCSNQGMCFYCCLFFAFLII